MLSNNGPERARTKYWTVSILGFLLIVIVLMTTCIMSDLVPGFRMEPSETPTQEMLIMGIATAIPASQHSINLPVILSPSGPVIAESAVQSPIWKVIKVRSLGYELNGERYDVAVFRRVDSQDTVKAYCIDRGLDTPELGAEYLQNPDGIFVPLQGPDTNPLQRFLVIQ